MLYKDLGNGYFLREITIEELKEIQKNHHEKVFSNRAGSNYIENLSNEEKEKIKSRSMNRWQFRVALFHNDEPVGWHYGYAAEPDVYYMQNSAVLESHRNKGLYSKMLASVLEHLKENAFQVVTSLHHPNNAAVIIPKLKLGFVICTMLVHERFRTLIEMKYFFDPERKKHFDEQLGLIL